MSERAASFAVGAKPVTAKMFLRKIFTEHIAAVTTATSAKAFAVAVKAAVLTV